MWATKLDGEGLGSVFALSYYSVGLRCPQHFLSRAGFVVCQFMVCHLMEKAGTRCRLWALRDLSFLVFRGFTICITQCVYVLGGGGGGLSVHVRVCVCVDIIVPDHLPMLPGFCPDVI